ncbi:MAG: translation elongation factor Ts [Buchnera aphidicola (Meitanaphis flavogallis)]
MKKITALLVKKLRIQTGSGILDCKKALIETQGDIEKSVDFLRKLGCVKAKQKQSFFTSYGVIFIGSNNKCAAMVELNCETDFVTKEDSFLSFGRNIIHRAITLRTNDDSSLLKTLFEEERVHLVSKLSENIVIRRIVILHGTNINSYLHHRRIGVLIKTTSQSNQALMKNIAMHVASSKPEYLRPDLIPSAVIEREYKIQLELAMQSNKPESIVEKIVKGRMIKFSNEKSLFGQNFIFDPQKTVGEIVIENNIDIVSFVRFEVGELICK